MERRVVAVRVLRRTVHLREDGRATGAKIQGAHCAVVGAGQQQVRHARQHAQPANRARVRLEGGHLGGRGRSREIEGDRWRYRKIEGDRGRYRET